MKTIGVFLAILLLCVVVGLVVSLVVSSVFLGSPWDWNDWRTRDEYTILDPVFTSPIDQSDVDTEELAQQSAMQVSMETVGCHIIHESVIEEGMDHVSTSGDFIHVEYWWPGQPERETVLDASIAGGGRYNFSRTLRGWVWEYADCTYDEVVEQVKVHISRRLAGGANNDGFYAFGVEFPEAWHPSNVFAPVNPTP